MSKGKQPDLFDDNWFVISDVDVLRNSLAFHAVVPAGMVENAMTAEVLRACSFLCCKGNLPGSIFSVIESQVKAGCQPVFLRLDRTSLAAELSSREFDLEGISGFSVLAGPLPLSHVSAVCFRDEKSLEDFKSQPYSDIRLDLLQYEVEDPVDESGEIEIDIDRLTERLGKELSQPVQELNWQRANKLVGGLACLGKIFPADSIGFGKLTGILSIDKSDADASTLEEKLKSLFLEYVADDDGSSSLSAEFQLTLFQRVLDSLEHRTPGKGFVVEEFLNDVFDEVRKTVSSEDNDQLLADLRSYYDEVLQNQKKPDLSDYLGAVQRGFLYFLMRRDRPEDVILVDPDSLLPVGPRVRAVAGFLAGFFVGFCNLDASVKEPDSLGRHLGSLFCLLTNDQARGYMSLADVECSINVDENFDKHYRILVDGQPCIEKHRRASAWLQLSNATPEIRLLLACVEYLELAPLSWSDSRLNVSVDDYEVSLVLTGEQKENCRLSILLDGTKTTKQNMLEIFRRQDRMAPGCRGIAVEAGLAIVMDLSMAKLSPEELNDGLHHILAAVAVVRDVK